MAAKKTAQRKLFTVAQANGALPLIRVIVRDITQLARELEDRQERLMDMPCDEGVVMDEAHREELESMQADLERDQDRMQEYQEELESLGVILKDYQTGLIDFPARMDDRDVFLCWRMGEPEVAYWHELEAGFAGRQRLTVDASRG
jgi:hypothetical protein